jgi:DNA-binding IclR family transcriptional regulator
MSAKITSRAGANRVAGTESSRRLLSVLFSFTELRPTWSVAELSESLALTQSAVYRYVGLLREVGLVDNAPDNRYRLSERTAALAAAAAAARAPLGDVALPVIERLRDTIDEAVFVARRIGWHAFTVARAESRKPVRLQFEPGQAMRLHIGSMPRILLASLSEKEQERYLAGLDDAARTSEFLTPAALDRVRRERVTESFEEIDEGIWGVAAAIVDGEEIVGAIGCAAPIYRTDEDKRRMIRQLIVAGAAEVSSALT